MSKDYVPAFLTDSDKVSLNQYDIFDRIINLKLTAENGETYVIRSDYEMFFPEMMKTVAENDYQSFSALRKCQIRKCQYKPSIKVQYKRVSLNTDVMIDIFISNFVMLDKNGQIINGFNNQTYKLKSVALAMGYFGQFDALFSKRVPSSWWQLFNIGFTEDTGYGINVITMDNVQYTQIDSLPPDMVLHIHGFVGNHFSSPINSNGKTLSSYKEIIQSSRVISTDKSFLEKVYFEYITKRWLKKSGSLADLSLMMNDVVAEKNGIKVYLSKKAVEKSKEIAKTKYKKDSKGNLIVPLTKITLCDTAVSQMNVIANALGLEGFSFTTVDVSGDYIVFLKEELNDIKGLLKGTELMTEYEKTQLHLTFNNQIPCVYNITSDALCTIVCPFFSIINPFEKLYFKSRYALGGIVTYYTNFGQADEFYALWQNISFATVDDVNECMIVCTGAKKEE